MLKSPKYSNIKISILYTGFEKFTIFAAVLSSASFFPVAEIMVSVLGLASIKMIFLGNY